MNADDQEELDRMHLIAFGAIGLAGAIIGAAFGFGLALWWVC